MSPQGFQLSNQDPESSAREVRAWPLLSFHKRRTGRFVTLSILFHAVAVAVVTFVNPALFMDPPHNEIIEMEVTTDSGPAPIPPQGAPAAPAAPAPEKVAEDAKAEAPAVAAAPAPAPAPEVKEDTAPKALPEKAKPVAVKAPPVKAAAKPVAVAKAAAVPADNVDDIQTPDLDAAGDVPVNAKLDEKDLSDDFEKVDHENSKKVADARKSMDEEADKAASENDDALKAADQEAKAQAEQMAEAAKSRRAKEAAEIAATAAAEKAAAEQAAVAEARRAAREEAARQAAAARQAQLAQEAAAREAAARAAQATASGGQGENQVSDGSADSQKPAGTADGGVRALAQLRQMPGNKFPQYSQDERLLRQQGGVVFHAYVNSDGSLSQFELVQSTGFQNLDDKTLAALKKWRFFPGQEGWVEMPFQWSLKGEALEAGGQLGKRQARK